MSSELVLARLLKNEGRILTPNFYYGTELRILYYTQISALLFRFTDSWYMVRVLSNIIMLMIMLISMWFLALRLGIRQYFPIIGIILMLPFSLVYYKFILYGLYYIPCIATSFFAMAMILHYHQASDKRIRILLMAGSTLLAVISSLIGYRQMAMFYLPATLGAFTMLAIELHRSKSSIKETDALHIFVISLINLIGSGVGCMINSIALIKKYPVEDWNDLSFTRFDLSRFNNTFCGIVSNLGYHEEDIKLSTLISNGYAVVLMLIFIYAFYKAISGSESMHSEHSFCVIYSMCAILLICLLYSMTDMSYNDRYSAPVTVFVIPVVILFVNEKKLSDTAKTLIFIAMAFLTFLISVPIYKDIKNDDQTAEQREIVSYLTDHDYTSGYGTFWHANVLTELSNGVIDMYSWHNEVMFPTVESINYTWNWLQIVSHDTDRPQGKVFQIYDDDDLYFCPWKNNLSDEDIIYKTPTYTIYGYTSYDDMMAKVATHDIALSESDINYGECTNKSVILESTGVLTSQDILFYRGTDHVTVTGDNLEQVDMNVKYYVTELAHSVDYDGLKIIEQDKNKIVAEIPVPNDTAGSKIVLTNNSNNECIITSIIIDRIGP